MAGVRFLFIFEIIKKSSALASSRATPHRSSPRRTHGCTRREVAARRGSQFEVQPRSQVPGRGSGSARGSTRSDAHRRRKTRQRAHPSRSSSAALPPRSSLHPLLVVEGARAALELDEPPREVAVRRALAEPVAAPQGRQCRGRRQGALRPGWRRRGGARPRHAARRVLRRRSVAVAPAAGRRRPPRRRATQRVLERTPRDDRSRRHATRGRRKL